MKARFSRFNRRWVILLSVVVACLSLALVWILQQETPMPVIAMLPENKLPATKLPVPDRWLPTGAAWGWLWRLKQGIFGRAKTGTVDLTMVEFKTLTDSELSRLTLGPPGF